MEKKFVSPQESFWSGEFGIEYIARNRSDSLHASNLAFFARALRNAGKIESCVELGANIGMNLRALKSLLPEAKMEGVEINPVAVEELSDLVGDEAAHQRSILDWEPDRSFDLALIKTVLIHIKPDLLTLAYDRLYRASRKWILLAEYYNPSPITVSYRGHENRLFKRDFAGDLLEIYDDLRLVDYGFVYRRDPTFPQDDITWFLMHKGADL